jgi:hypothetical protein
MSIDLILVCIDRELWTADYAPHMQLYQSANLSSKLGCRAGRALDMKAPYEVQERGLVVGPLDETMPQVQQRA